MTLDMANRDMSVTAMADIGTLAREISISSTNCFADIEADWRALEAQGIESPGQSYDFLATWIAAFQIPEADQQFIIVRAGQKPIVALALQRQRMWGMRVLSPFPGGHVGTNAPVVDHAALAAMSDTELAALWKRVGEALEGAELAYLCCYPAAIEGRDNPFERFGLHTRSDALHRSVFTSWADCNAVQRTRSRRKHDKQQGAKLSALGDVQFDVLGADDDVAEVLDCMFAQRNARFVQQGIADPFSSENVRRFYKQVFANQGDLAGRLHVLRLDGEIVAVRFNLTHGDRMFCLISSMSIAPRIQPGSPGKQCLLRVMQTEFDNGYTMFDMGSGFTDEKRHWCNVHIPLRHHYVPMTLRGHLFTHVHRAWQRLKVRLKANQRAFALIKNWRVKMRGGAL